ncbi:CPBP family intramembrane metalloprotease [Deinococcus sp. KNUC1210]|uniref:CPBP family intramembrane glutamic endopeptidase n=1 Tax=Deinococcus sp. KNUC1210 TaxID=2917691 RepID=UPI001EF09C47|nr:type II CAAX endopeptidase family protein [Deinococcus sp. KNUC1210]ULH16754.1 CPBP family intramembrane metalloprotease [Deinococcus sp. KNUC1210]
MTDWLPPPPAASPPSPPADSQPGGIPIRPLDGNRALLLLLVTQTALVSVLVARGVPLGLSALLGVVATVLAALLLMRGTLIRLIQDTRWRTPPAIWTALGALALGVIASRGLLVFVLSVSPKAVANLPDYPTSGLDTWLFIVVGGLLIPVAEEVVFRGLLMRGFEQARGPVFAALVSGLLFSLAHGVPAQIAAIVPIAWVLARSNQASGSLWTGVLIHALNNGGSLLLVQLLSGTQLMDQAQKQLGQQAALPLQLGVAGLLVAAAAMFVATLWLRPRPDLPAPVGGPVISATLVTAVIFILLIVLSQIAPLRTLVGR